ncbi:MAG: translation initiation factor IF-3 [Chthoniobacteraceae bacterium]
MLHGARTNADKTIQLQSIRINQRIRAKEVRVVLASTGEQLGVMRIQDALRKAMELGLDLVEVSANAVPPVCRIVDFGKFKYELSKNEKEKKQNAASKMKEVKFRVNIGTHDYETKLRHAEEFLDKGNKVRMLLQFRGREMAHQELGMGLMGKIRKHLETMGHPEAEPKLIGRNIFMTLVPLPAGKRKRHFYGPHDMELQEPDEHDEADRDVDEAETEKK